MKQKWGRMDDAGEFPSDRAAWTIGAFCLALLSVFAIGLYRYMRVWTPLQRHYLTTYVGTPVAEAANCFALLISAYSSDSEAKAAGFCITSLLIE